MGGEAHAGILQITISEGATSYVILDEGPLDTLVAPPPSNINHIRALAAALIFPDYRVVSLNASANYSIPSLGASLTVGGEVQRLTAGVAPALTISVTDTDYSVPSVPGRKLQSNALTTFTGAPAGDHLTFTSWYNPTNAPYATDIVQGPPVPLFLSSTGLSANSHEEFSFLRNVPDAGLYGLTNTTVITLSGEGADVTFFGNALVIPEPASLLLMALGLPLALWRSARRRTT
jgi:hypothetical protein